MKYKVPQDILDTTPCPKEFKCLIDGVCGEHGECKVIYTAGEDIALLNSGVTQQILQQCPFAVSSDDGVVCRCPVRNYLY